jgi:diaminopimelate epimerase
MSALRLWRAHGLGNDYLVLEEGPPLGPDLVRALCDRHRGPGGDGILEPTPTDRADHGVRIWNPDGSVAEKSGNGLRIFAAWVGRRTGRSSFTLDTGHDRVEARLGPPVTLSMGRATPEPAAVPLRAERPVVDARWTLSGHPVSATVVSVGNPHCVLFVDAADLDALPWRDWGQALETDPRFPRRTNVQVARIREDGGVDIRIWERGAGPTLASGSSSCAVAAAAVLTGRLPPGPIAAHMPGGILRITVSPTLDLELAGPVEGIATLVVEDDWLQARGFRDRP